MKFVAISSALLLVVGASAQELQHHAAPVPEPVSVRETPSSLPVAAHQTRVAVLGYSRVGKGKIELSPADFEQQMFYLRESGLRVISPSDFISWRLGNCQLPAQCVLLTFEEADAAFAEHILPVLQRCEFPFLVFADGDNLKGRKTDKGELDSEQLRALQADGAEIGSLTMRRPYAMEWQMAQIAGGDRIRRLVEQEIEESASQVSASFGTCRAFSYPWGYTDDIIKAALLEANYVVGFTRDAGKASSETEAYSQPRYMVKNNSVFARAINFGEPTEAAAVLEALKSCRPAIEIAAANVTDGVVLPEFSDDDVAEEVVEDPSVASASATEPAPAPATEPTPAPATEPTPAPATEPTPAPATEPTPAPATEPAPAPATEPAPAPATEPAPAPATEPAPAPATEPAPAPATEPAPAPATEPAPAPATEPAPAPATEPAPAPATEPAPAPATDPAPATESYPAVQPEVGKLGKRSKEGDWVSSQFKQPLVAREETRVAVLGYHNFSKTKNCTEMRMSTADFCRQMQFLKDSDIDVISMQDFLEWRHGSRRLPARCVLITIDDGWKSVYTDAYPVLKAYGYPFTLYLYTRYIDVKGDSMTSEQIREMMANGATIGSHSSNHLYPSKWKRYSQGSAQYAAQLQKELKDSRTKLRNMFGNCSTYCYPGGYNTAPMHATLEAAGYEAAFTVLESKVGCEEKKYEVHRYMIFGINHEIFRRAVNFSGEEGVTHTREAIAAAEAPARKFFPSAFEGCTNRVPLPKFHSARAKKSVPVPTPAVQPTPTAPPVDATPVPANSDEVSVPATAQGAQPITQVSELSRLSVSPAVN